MTVFWRAVFGVAFAASATASVAQAPVQKDGIEVTVAAVGSTTSKADYVATLVPIAASGDTAAQVRAAVTAKVANFRGGVAKAGIPASAIKTLQPRAYGFIGNEAYDDEDQPLALPAMRKARASANALYRIELSTPAQLEAVKLVLDEQGLMMNPTVDASLRDEEPAMRVAIADAVKKGRAQAEAYASAAGLHIVSLKRIENNCTNSDASVGWTSRINKLQMQMFGSDLWMVETTAGACLTFLAER